MLAPSLLAANTPLWQTLVITLAGVCATALALLLGFMLISRRRGAPPPARSGGRQAPASGQADPFMFGSALEKRTAHRRRGNSVRILLADAQSDAAPHEGWVIDRSVGGLCLLVEQQDYPVGTVLNVRAASAPATTPWTQVEVRDSRKKERGWELGCQFKQTPSWSVLLLFG